MKQFLKDYFSFSKSDRNALIILIVILTLIICINYSLPYFTTHSQSDFSQFEQEVDRFVHNLSQIDNENGYYKKSGSDFDPDQDEITKSQVKLFYFDPNNITKEEWISLGVKPKIANTIQNYLETGWRFKKKEDLKKIYGFKRNLYFKLKPYIRIENKTEKKDYSSGSNTKYEKVTYPIEKETFVVIELNSATAEELKKLKGIGNTFSNRIIAYRDLLGGFNKKEQLLEVYGFNDSLYHKIKDNVEVDATKITKISINLSNIKTLSKHLYIDYSLAKKIIDDRTINGPFKTLKELKERGLIEDSKKFNKISPYLKLW